MIKLLKKADCKVTYVDYPLAPEHTFLETIQMAVDAYKLLSAEFPDDHFILMGDSAGGGLALVLAQFLRDHMANHQPIGLILYSPWVRLDMENPHIQAMNAKDLLLDVDTLKHAAKSYAGDEDLSHPYLSPFYGSCEDLGQMDVFFGSDELLTPDIALLEKKCQAEGTNAAFHCFEGMQHVFNLFTFLPENQDVFQKTIALINQETGCSRQSLPHAAGTIPDPAYYGIRTRNSK